MREKAMKWQDYVVVDPKICHGKACIKRPFIMKFKIDENLLSVKPLKPPLWIVEKTRVRIRE